MSTPLPFHLDLSKEFRCSFHATGEMSRWLEKYAVIMGLRAGGLDGGWRVLLVDRRPSSGSQDRSLVEEFANALPERSSASDWQEFQLADVLDGAVSNELRAAVFGLNRAENDRIWYLSMSFATHLLHRLALEVGGLTLHAGAVVRDEKAVLLSAPSATGKSTAVKRVGGQWRPLCDDQVLLLPNGAEGWRAHPLPTWSDYFLARGRPVWDVHAGYELAGLVFLQQGEQTELKPLDLSRAVAWTNQGARFLFTNTYLSTWERDHAEWKRRLFLRSRELVEKTPVFRLDLTLHDPYWELLDRELAGK